jgi:hypothetical protein
MGFRSALLAVLVMFAVLPVAAAARTGAYSLTRPLDDKTRALALSLRGPAEQLTNERYSVWRPVSYRSQVVAGTNYLFVRETGAARRALRCDVTSDTLSLLSSLTPSPSQLVDVGDHRVEVKAFAPLPYTKQPILVESVTPLGPAPSPADW